MCGEVERSVFRRVFDRGSAEVALDFVEEIRAGRGGDKKDCEQEGEETIGLHGCKNAPDSVFWQLLAQLFPRCRLFFRRKQR